MCCFICSYKLSHFNTCPPYKQWTGHLNNYHFHNEFLLKTSFAVQLNCNCIHSLTVSSTGAAPDGKQQQKLQPNCSSRQTPTNQPTCEIFYRVTIEQLTHRILAVAAISCNLSTEATIRDLAELQDSTRSYSTISLPPIIYGGRALLPCCDTVFTTF